MVKSTDKILAESHLLDTIMRLRYNDTRPHRSDKALFSYGAIAKYLGINLKIISKIAQQYFRHQENRSNTKPNITQEHIDYLTSDEYFEANTTKSLSDRVIDFNNNTDFDVHINVYYLRKIYREAKIKKKRIVKMPGNPTKFPIEVTTEMLKNIQHELIVADLKRLTIY